MSKPSQKRDYELIRRINEGDASAFRQLVYLYKDVSLSLVHSILKNPTISEDVLQDVFVKVYHKLHTFKFNASFATWLYRIAVNTAYNELKKRNLEISRYTESSTTLIVPDAEKELLKLEDQQKYIRLAMEKLRPDESLALRLFYLCEMSMKEIQEITQFSISKIKTDLKRGKENLHFHLQQLLGDDLNHLL